MGFLQKLFRRKMHSCTCYQGENAIIDIGDYRDLTNEEKHDDYVYAITVPYKYTDGLGRTIEVPVEFLTDGASGPIPDWGHAWIYHDWLYATHKFSSGEECSRREADNVMAEVLKQENLNLYRLAFRILTRMNFLCLFSRAWKNSGHRGPEFVTVNEIVEQTNDDNN